MPYKLVNQEWIVAFRRINIWEEVLLPALASAPENLNIVELFDCCKAYRAQNKTRFKETWQLTVLSRNLEWIERVLTSLPRDSKDTEGNMPIHYLAGANFKIGFMNALHHHPHWSQALNNNGATIAHHAAAAGDIDCTLTILKKYPELLLAKDSDGNTIAHYSAAASQGKCVQVLLKTYPDLQKVRNSDGCTVAHAAAWSTAPECLLAVLETNFDLHSIKDHKGITVEENANANGIDYRALLMRLVRNQYYHTMSKERGWERSFLELSKIRSISTELVTPCYDDAVIFHISNLKKHLNSKSPEKAIPSIAYLAKHGFKEANELVEYFYILAQQESTLEKRFYLWYHGAKLKESRCQAALIDNFENVTSSHVQYFLAAFYLGLYTGAPHYFLKAQSTDADQFRAFADYYYQDTSVKPEIRKNMSALICNKSRILNDNDDGDFASFTDNSESLPIQANNRFWGSIITTGDAISKVPAASQGSSAESYSRMGSRSTDSSDSEEELSQAFSEIRL